MERHQQIEEEIEEMGDINLMLEGLAAASRKAMASGLPLVYMQDEELVRREIDGSITVLESIPSFKVTERIKYRKPDA